jgi:hypothetical protein
MLSEMSVCLKSDSQEYVACLKARSFRVFNAGMKWLPTCSEHRF